MKSPSFRTLGCPLAVLALALLGLACQSPANYQRADRTGGRIAALRQDVVDIDHAVDATDQAMGEVVASANTDPRKAYGQFTKAIGRLESANEKARKRADDMRAEGREFFAQWEQEIASLQNPEVQRLARERRAALDKTFRNISRVTVELRDEFRPWLADVKDLHQFLGNDLTVAGIDSARGLIEKTRARTAKIRQGINTLIDELNAVEAALTPARNPPPAQ